MSPQQQTRRGVRRRKRHTAQILLTGAVLLLAVFFAARLVSQGKQKAAEAAQPTASGAASAEPGTFSPASEPASTAAQEPQEDRTEMPESALDEGTLVLVNEQYAYDPSLPRTVSVYENKTGSYLVKDIYLSVTPETMDALNAWMDAFAAETGITDVNIVAGWRSFADQKALYDNAVANKGQAYADAYLALPGHSEHHTGLAVDLDTYDLETGLSWGFDGAGDYAWAVEHAWEYGFVQRYPPSKRAITGIDYESWHFRYVGLPHSNIMSTNNLCLEEYIEYLRKFPFSGNHLFVSCLGVNYELYFCPKDQVVVPTAGSFTISGNNVDGFIVVLQKP